MDGGEDEEERDGGYVYVQDLGVVCRETGFELRSTKTNNGRICFGTGEVLLMLKPCRNTDNFTNPSFSTSHNHENWYLLPCQSMSIVWKIKSLLFLFFPFN